MKWKKSERYRWFLTLQIDFESRVLYLQSMIIFIDHADFWNLLFPHCQNPFIWDSIFSVYENKVFSWCQVERFGEKDLVFMKWRSCRHCFKNEWTLASLFIFSRFHSFNEPWYLHEDRQFYYDVQTNGGRFLSNWDWIGLYKEHFTSLDEYKGYIPI